MTINPRVACAAIVFAFGFSYATAAQEDVNTLYKRGKESYDKKQWQAAITDMQAAIRIKSEDTGDRAGSFGPRYWPHFYLGAALREQENCAGALDAWDVSISHKDITTRRDEYRVIQDGFDYCKGRGFLLAEALAEQIRSLDAVINDARGARRRLVDEISRFSTEWAASGLAKGLSAGDDFLASAEAAAKNARQVRQATAFETARSTAESARTRFTQTSIDFGDYRTRTAKPIPTPNPITPSPVTPTPSSLPSEALAKLADQARADLKQAAIELESVATLWRDRPSGAPAVSEDVSGSLQKVRTLLNATNRAVETAVLESNKDAVENAIKTAKNIRRQAAALRDLLTNSAGPPPALGFPEEIKTGANLFFTGEYERALATLTLAVIESADRSLRSHAHAIRAAAAFALYERSGRQREDLKTQAQTDIDACKLLDPAFEPRPDAFSQKFITFFKERRAPESR